MYRVRILDAATRDLARLDKQIANRVAGRISWLAAHFDVSRPEPLSGDLAGLFRFRVGDYRLIYQILHDEQTIIIHQIGHRREVYRRR